MVKRVVQGHKHTRLKTRVEVSVFFPNELFLRVREEWMDTPDSVSFSAFIVAKIEAGLEQD